MLRLQKNWHLICCVLWAVISIATTTETNPILAESAELEPSQEENSASSLLRNFFSVNLQKSQPPPPPPASPPRKQIQASATSRQSPVIVSKHKQKARLRGLFKALRNPLARK